MSRESSSSNKRGCAGCLVLAIPLVLWLVGVIAEDVAQDYYWPVLRGIWSFGWLEWLGWPIALLLLLTLGHSSNEYKIKLANSQGHRDRALALIGLYNIVLRSADNLVDREDEHRVVELTEAILVKAASVFEPTVIRASVYLLSEDGSRLTMYASHQMPTDYQREFHVENADPSRKPGVAGKAFLSKETQVAHFKLSEDGSSWECDHEDYFPHSNSKRAPQYRTFIAAPIASDLGYTVGVLCLDSQDVAAFDDISTQQVVEAIGNLIALTVDLAGRLQRGKPDVQTWS